MLALLLQKEAGREQRAGGGRWRGRSGPRCSIAYAAASRGCSQDQKGDGSQAVTEQSLSRPAKPSESRINGWEWRRYREKTESIR